MVQTIISGGQTWPELAALDTAIKMGIPYTGWRPGIQVPDQSAKTDKYRLNTLASNQPKDAIEKNVREADGTFIVSLGRLQWEADYARQMTLKNRKHLLGIDLNQHSLLETIRLVASWIEMNYLKSLHVTGSSEKEGDSLYHRTVQILESAILTSLSRSAIPQFTDLHATSIDIKGNRSTTTVAEAVKWIMSTLSLREKTYIASSNLEILCRPNNSFSLFIQKAFKLKEGNAILLKSCTAFSKKERITPAEASYVIIKAFWETLQETHRLRIIK